jgi:hypothetical protein
MSRAEEMKDWGCLLAACRASHQVKSFLSGDLETFEALIREAGHALVRQSDLEAERQKATRQLNEALAQARDQASHIRLGVRLHLGPRNERLKIFGITPVGQRRKQ